MEKVNECPRNRRFHERIFVLMAKKKPATRKKPISKKKAAAKKKSVARKKAAAAGKPVLKKKGNAAKRAGSKKKAIRREISSGSERSSLGSGQFSAATRPAKKGLGEGAAGQSGDLQGLSATEDVNDESVEELLEEGQAFEAEVTSGVENAPDPDEDEVHTHERPEDEFELDEDQ